MTLSFNGHDLESIAICGDPQISIFNFQPEFKDMKSRNGSLFVGTKLGASTVELTVCVTGNASERRAKLSTLGSWLVVDSPKQLVLPDTPDRYYLAVPSGAVDMKRGYDGEYAQLTFTLTDPTAYSTQLRSVTSVSGVAACNVLGNAPTEFVITNVDGGTVTPGSIDPQFAANYWSVSNGSASLNFGIGSDPGRKIIIDSEKRQCRFLLDNEYVEQWYTYLATAASTWFKLQPGANTITRTIGGGEFVVEWRDRWY